MYTCPVYTTPTGYFPYVQHTIDPQLPVAVDLSLIRMLTNTYCVRALKISFLCSKTPVNKKPRFQSRVIPMLVINGWAS